MKKLQVLLFFLLPAFSIATELVDPAPKDGMEKPVVINAELAERPYPGIFNPDSRVCYMASIIHVIFHIKELRQRILSMPTTTNDRVVATLQILLGRMQRKTIDEPIDMSSDFVETYRQYPPNKFADVNGEDDAREFYQTVEELTRSSTGDLLNATVVHTSIEAGKYVLSTNVDAIVKEHSSLIKVDVLDLHEKKARAASLQEYINDGDVDMIESYKIAASIQGDRAIEYLKSIGKSECEEHMEKVIKKLMIGEGSPILTVYLGRYRHSNNDHTIPQFDSSVHFEYEAEIEAGGSKYELQAVVKHEAIHYNVFTRSANNLRWIHINNEQVRGSELEEALAQKGNAYLLFYVRKGLLSPSEVEPELSKELVGRIEIFECLERIQKSVIGGINKINEGLLQKVVHQQGGGAPDVKKIDEAGKNFANLNYGLHLGGQEGSKPHSSPYY